MARSTKSYEERMLQLEKKEQEPNNYGIWNQQGNRQERGVPGPEGAVPLHLRGRPAGRLRGVLVRDRCSRLLPRIFMI